MVLLIMKHSPAMIEFASRASAEEIREFSMRFLLGVAIGELFNLGATEADIREAVDIAIAANAAPSSRGNA